MSIAKTGGLMVAGADLCWTHAPQPVWVPLMQDRAHGVDLRWGILKGYGNSQVVIQNFWTTTIQFDYQALGAQRYKKAEVNNRIHQDPNAKALC